VLEVSIVETYDRISGNRFVTRYAYHHGYFDGVEREFRGFGMVEQWDTQEIGTIQPGHRTSDSTNLDAASFVPPVHTKTWFHTGIYVNSVKKISKKLMALGTCPEKRYTRQHPDPRHTTSN
jgi:Insecticide toxin TcdB middle/N-terminal region